MVKEKLKTLLICPFCLSDRLDFTDKEIVCKDCGKHYPLSEYQSPNMTIFSRASIEKLKKHQSSEGTDITLDVGAGARQEGVLNVDIRPLKGIAVACNAMFLPFRNSTFERILLNQVIEHVRYDQALELLTELKRITKPGGVVEIWTPNFQSLGVFISWLKGGIDFSNPDAPLLYSPITGLQEYPENTHQGLWNLNLLKYYSKKAGLQIEETRTEQKYFGSFAWVQKLISAFFPRRRGQLYLRARNIDGIDLKTLKPAPRTDVWKDCPPHVTVKK